MLIHATTPNALYTAIDLQERALKQAQEQAGELGELERSRVITAIVTDTTSPGLDVSQVFKLHSAHIALPAIMRRAMFITICACAENWFNNMCRDVEQ